MLIASLALTGCLLDERQAVANEFKIEAAKQLTVSARRLVEVLGAVGNGNEGWDADVPHSDSTTRWRQIGVATYYRMEEISHRSFLHTHVLWVKAVVGTFTNALR